MSNSAFTLDMGVMNNLANYGVKVPFSRRLLTGSFSLRVLGIHDRPVIRLMMYMIVLGVAARSENLDI